MVISNYLFFVIAITVILLIACILCTLYSFISEKENLKHSLLTVPHYLQERFAYFFSKNVIVGLYKSVFFIIYILVFPFLISIFMRSQFGDAYKIIEREDGFDYISCAIIGNSITTDGKSVKVNKDKYYIFNNTDKNFCLKQEFYSYNPSGLHGYRSLDEYEDKVDIPPHSYIETEHSPEYWFVAPNTMSSNSTKVEEEGKVWGVLLDQ